MIEIMRLRPVGPFRLRVDVSDGSSGEHGSSALVAGPGPTVEPLRETAYFDRVVLDVGSPSRPDGVDVAPDWLWREMMAAGELDCPDASRKVV